VGTQRTARFDIMLCYPMVKDRVKKMLEGRDDIFYALSCTGTT